MQTAAGQERWLHVFPAKNGLEFGTAHIHPSADGRTIDVYGPYTAPGYEYGVFLTTLDLSKLELAPPQLFPCPADTTRKLREMGYLDERKFMIAADRAQYVCNELSDGAIVLTGYLVNAVWETATDAQADYSYMQYYGGPILNYFIKDGKASVGVIYRDQPETRASGFITIPYGNELICIYTDYADNIHSDRPWQHYATVGFGNPVLACAVITVAGKVTGREKLADTDGSLRFF